MQHQKKMCNISGFLLLLSTFCIGSILCNQPPICVQGRTCVLPECRCKTTREPIFSENKDSPQIVSLVFEGSVNRANFPYLRDVFRRAAHINGKPMSGTLFVNEYLTDFSLVEILNKEYGYELGLYGVRPVRTPVTGSFTPPIWRSLLREHRIEVARRAKVPVDSIQGFRNNLARTEEFMYDALQKEGFKYDSSGRIKLSKVVGQINQWPFSLHYGWGRPCQDRHCPVGNYSKLWEIPRVTLYNAIENRQCEYVSSCSGVDSISQMTQALADNFVSVYRGPRTPMIITVNLNHGVLETFFKILNLFVKGLQDRPDIFLVKLSDVLAWVKHPTPLDHVGTFHLWNEAASSTTQFKETIQHPVAHAQDGFPRPSKPIRNSHLMSHDSAMESFRVMEFNRIVKRIETLKRTLARLPTSGSSAKEYDIILSQIANARHALERLSTETPTLPVPTSIVSAPPVTAGLSTYDLLMKRLAAIKQELVNAKNHLGLKKAAAKYKALMVKIKSERQRLDALRSKLVMVTNSSGNHQDSKPSIKNKQSTSIKVWFGPKTEYKPNTHAGQTTLPNTNSLAATNVANSGNINSTADEIISSVVNSNDIARLVDMLRKAKGNTTKLSRMRLLVAELMNRYRAQKKSGTMTASAPPVTFSNVHLIQKPTKQAAVANEPKDVNIQTEYVTSPHSVIHPQVLHGHERQTTPTVVVKVPLMNEEVSPQASVPSENPPNEFIAKINVVDAPNLPVVHVPGKPTQVSSVDNVAWMYGAPPYSRKDAPRLPDLSKTSGSNIASDGQRPACTDCCLPFCRDANAGTPGNLRISEIPQLVVLMFHGKLDLTLYDAITRLFQPNSNNPNGCSISMTYFASGLTENYDLIRQLYQQGVEIGVNTLTSTAGNREFWANISPAALRSEITGMQRNLVERSRIPIDEIVGFRMPHVHPVGDAQYEILKNTGFLYDSSLRMRKTSLAFGGEWPFTLDKGWTKKCEQEPCPTRTYPGLWEVPVISLVNDPAPNPLEAVDLGKSHKAYCSFVDSCNPKDFQKYLMNNFVSHYHRSREPFYLNFDGNWLKQERYIIVLIQFIRGIMKQNDVYVVSAKQTIDWVKDPKSLIDIQQSTWAC